MSFIKRIYLFILFSAIGIMTLSANDNGSIKFSHISLNNGLSQSTVFSIAQDKRGNMWFATYDGVMDMILLFISMTLLIHTV